MQRLVVHRSAPAQAEKAHIVNPCDPAWRDDGGGVHRFHDRRPRNNRARPESWAPMHGRRGEARRSEPNATFTNPRGRGVTALRQHQVRQSSHGRQPQIDQLHGLRTIGVAVSQFVFGMKSRDRRVQARAGDIAPPRWGSSARKPGGDSANPPAAAARDVPPAPEPPPASPAQRLPWRRIRRRRALDRPCRDRRKACAHNLVSGLSRPGQAPRMRRAPAARRPPEYAAPRPGKPRGRDRLPRTRSRLKARAS